MEALRQNLRRAVKAHMAQDPAHDIAHLDRVWANALRISRAEDNPNLRVLLAASYLHDLVNLPKNAPNRTQASQLAATAAAPILQELAFDAVEIAKTQHAIAAHSFSAGIPPQTLEARILRDADRLDALGAIGIARCFSVSGSLNRALYDPEDPFATARALDDQAYALDHWPIKLLHLPRDMLTSTGHAIADQRMAVMQAYITALADEMDMPVPDNWSN